MTDHRHVRRRKPCAGLKPLVHALKAGPTGDVLHPLMDQDSHPASREFKSCVLVEAFLGRGHVDVDGFLEQQLPGVSGHACISWDVTVGKQQLHGHSPPLHYIPSMHACFVYRNAEYIQHNFVSDASFAECSPSAAVASGPHYRRVPVIKCLRTCE